MKPFLFLLLSSAALAADIDIQLARPAISLKAHVANDGEVTVLEYPKEWTSTLSILGPGPEVQFFKDLKESTCKEVESFAKQAADPFLPPMAKERALELVRKANAFILKMDIGSQLKSNEIIAKVREKIDLPTLNLHNPLAIKNVEFNFVLGDKAISRHLKSDQAAKTWMEILGTGLKNGGEAVAEIPTMDILCDLAQGNAELKATITVEELNRKLTRLLLPMDDAKAVAQRLNREKGNFSGEALGSNRVLATLILIDVLAERNIPRPSKEDVVSIVEKLTQANGAPKELSDVEVKNAMTVPMAGDNTYPVDSVVKLEAK